jgi:ubiquitin-activating enzyme E1
VEELTDSVIKEYDVVVFSNYNVHELIKWNVLCRVNGIKFIMINSNGLMGTLFCDFGDEHKVLDTDGEPVSTGIVESIKNNTITTTEPHKLYTGDVIKFNKYQRTLSN